MCRRIAGSAFQKSAAEMIVTTPPQVSVHDAEAYVAPVPANRLPNTVTPRDNVVKKLTIRPRRRSGTRLCNKILVPARLLTIPYPIVIIAAAESQNDRLHEKINKPMPKRATERAMERPRPFTVPRRAWRKAAKSAPTPLAAISAPKPPGPLLRMSWAKTGNRVLYGMAKMLKTAVTASTART